MSQKTCPPHRCHLESLLHAGIPQKPSFLQVSHLDPPPLKCHSQRPSSTQVSQRPLLPILCHPAPLSTQASHRVPPGLRSHPEPLLCSCVPWSPPSLLCYPDSCSPVALESILLLIITQSPSLTCRSLSVPVPPATSACFTEPSLCSLVLALSHLELQ